jgi:hypothetical protein
LYVPENRSAKRALAQECANNVRVLRATKYTAYADQGSAVHPTFWKNIRAKIRHQSGQDCRNGGNAKYDLDQILTPRKGRD